MMTVYGTELSDDLFLSRINSLVNQFYKILPIKESGEPTLKQYMSSLQREMLGCQSLIVALQNDPQYLSLLSILQYLIENDCEVSTVRGEVFKAISILKKMHHRYMDAKE